MFLWWKFFYANKNIIYFPRYNDDVIMIKQFKNLNWAAYHGNKKSSALWTLMYSWICNGLKRPFGTILFLINYMTVTINISDLILLKHNFTQWKSNIMFQLQTEVYKDWKTHHSEPCLANIFQYFSSNNAHHKYWNHLRSKIYW